MRVPCAGWLHPLTVQRALRHGAAGVLIVSCGAGSQMYREGGTWTLARMSGAREPTLDLSTLERSDDTSRAPLGPGPKPEVRVLEAYRSDLRRLARDADAFRRASLPLRPRRKAFAYMAGLTLATVLGGAAWAGTRVHYRPTSNDAPELVVSFKHPGNVEERCRDLTADEKTKTPPHMRPASGKICDRRRVAVRLRVRVDDAVVIDHAYEPKGIWNDGNSVALERLRVTPGQHLIRVEIGDTDRSDEWNHVDERTIEFAHRTSRVIRFDKTEGFTWR
jgi:hypothetical protein